MPPKTKPKNTNGKTTVSRIQTKVREKSRTLLMKIENQLKFVVDGITSDPTALVFLFAAFIFTMSESVSGENADLLADLIKRLADNEVTKSLSAFLAKQRPLFFAFLWFSIAVVASSEKARPMVIIFALALVYWFHQRDPWEFAAMAITLYAFFKIKIPVVRFILILILGGIFWYYMTIGNPVENTIRPPAHHRRHHAHNASKLTTTTTEATPDIVGG